MMNDETSGAWIAVRDFSVSSTKGEKAQTQVLIVLEAQQIEGERKADGVNLAFL